MTRSRIWTPIVAALPHIATVFSLAAFALCAWSAGVFWEGL